MYRTPSFRPSRIFALVGLAVLLSCAALAQNYVAPSVPVIGSANTVTANPTVPRPATTPCTVQLFVNLDFADFNPKYFDYAPPAGCPGPWAAVVFEADWSVDAGRQFDRTGEIWIGGANIFFGTTPEPSHNVERTWHTESNLTQMSPLFSVAQQGRVDLGNLVNDEYTSHIHGTASIQFYPLAQGQNPPVTASLVLPFSASSTGGTVTLNSPTDQLAATYTMPTNVERAFLEVFAQGQSSDEFWYTCAPNDVAGELFSCPSTSFREAEVTIDGTPAGVSPVYPWIFTGGIDPYLWRPIPGVHTLNFEPYAVDLTPFASVLSNGQPHTIAVSVYNADQYFSATANLLLYQDAGSTQITGAVTNNTVGAPDPSVVENISNNRHACLRHPIRDFRSRFHRRRLCADVAWPRRYQGGAEHRLHQRAEVLRATGWVDRRSVCRSDNFHLVGHDHAERQQRDHEQPPILVASDFVVRLQRQPGWLVPAVHPDQAGVQPEPVDQAEWNDDILQQPVRRGGAEGHTGGGRERKFQRRRPAKFGDLQVFQFRWRMLEPDHQRCCRGVDLSNRRKLRTLKHLAVKKGLTCGWALCFALPFTVWRRASSRRLAG